MDLVKELIKAFEDAKIDYMNIEMDNLKLKMKKNTQREVINTEVVTSPHVIEKVPVKEEVNQYFEVKSPIVGTFYNSSSPDSDPFISEGSHVVKGDTLCIVEAMKVMNEIKSPVNGVIKRVIVKNEEFVEYDQVLIHIEEDHV